MPIYEYCCRKCATSFELLVRTSDRPICPDCGSQQLEKLLSVPAAHTGAGQDLSICGGGPQAPCGMGGCGIPECGT